MTEPRSTGPPPAAPAARPEDTIPSPGERRQQLTIMFCDLVGSTSLSRRLDPEEFGDVKETFTRTCAAKVEQYGGHVAQVIGDGLLVYFGWPTVHEDDPDRSVLAALETVEAVRDIRGVAPLAAHIGIATGRVAVRGGVASGECPSLAARLEKAAGPHEVLISARRPART